MRSVLCAFLTILIGCAFASDQASRPGVQRLTVRGWLSDEACANARASSGLFTGTSPRCAKECVSKGRKVVLIDPDHKRILAIENQGAVPKDNVGDFVEVDGALGAQKKSLHIDSLKMVSKGAAACARPQLEN